MNAEHYDILVRIEDEEKTVVTVVSPFESAEDEAAYNANEAFRAYSSLFAVLLPPWPFGKLSLDALGGPKPDGKGGL
jgi:hypothetical protein